MRLEPLEKEIRYSVNRDSVAKPESSLRESATYVSENPAARADDRPIAMTGSTEINHLK